MIRMLAASCILLFSTAVHAEGVSACNDALVKSTYNKLDTQASDYRLAMYVSREAYDEVKHNGGINVVIYGVPVGANYDDFHSRAEKEVSDKHESLSESQAHNLMWTGLDPNSTTTYSDCLRAVVFSTAGLHIATKSATKSDVALLVRWTPQGNNPGRIPVTWSQTGPSLRGFPETLTQGETTIVVPRPTAQYTLAVNWPGFTSSITLEPLPPPLMPVAAGLPNINGKWCRRDNPSAPSITISQSSGHIMVTQSVQNGQPIDVADMLTLGPNPLAGASRPFISRDMQTNNVDEFTFIEHYNELTSSAAYQIRCSV